MSCMYVINREDHLGDVGGGTERLGAGWDWGGNQYGQKRRGKKSGKANGTTCKIPLESETLRN